MKLSHLKRWALRLFFVLFVCGIVFIIGWKLLFFFLKDITQNRLTLLFQTEVSLENVQILEWKSWNQLKIQVENIRLKGTQTDSVTQVAYANKISAVVPIVDIFLKKDTIHVRDLTIDSLFLDFYADSQRKKNYKLFKPYDPHRLSGPKWVQFHHAYIRACKFHYYFKLHDRDYHFELQNIYPQLIIRKEDIDLQLDLKGYIPYLRERNTIFMQNASLDFHYIANIKKYKQDNIFKECKMLIGGVPVEIGGRFYLGWERDYNLNLKVKHAHTDSLLNLFPKDIQEKVKVYDIQGNINIEGKIIGKWKPEFHVHFEADSVNITNTITKVGLRHLKLKGKFFNGGEAGKAFAELNVDTLSGYIYQKPFLAYFTIKDFNQFFINGHFEMSQNLAVVGKWMGFKDNQNAKGFVEASIDINGNLKDIAAFDMEKVHLNGYLNAENISLPASWTPFEITNTHFQLLFNNHEILLKNAKSYINQQPVEVSGWLSTKAFELKPLFIANASVIFDTLSPEKFLQKSFQKNAQIFPTLPNNFFVNIDVQAKHILYKKIQLQETKAQLSIKPYELILHQLKIKGKEDSLILMANFQQFKKDTIQFTVHQFINTRSVLDIFSELGFSFDQWKWSEYDIVLINQTQIIGKIYRSGEQKVDGEFYCKLLIDRLYYPNPVLEITNFQANLNTTLSQLLNPKKSSWLLHHIQAELNHQPFVGSIGLIPTQNGFWLYPSLEMELCLESLQPFLKPDNISDYEGNFQFTFFGKGALKNFLKPDSAVYQSSHGEIWINNLAFLIENKNLPVDSISGMVFYNDEGVWANPICGKIGNSDFCLKGNTKEILAYLFLKNTRLDGKISLISDSLFIKDFTAESFSKSKEEKIKNFNIKLPDNVYIDLDAQVLYAFFDRLKFQYLLLNACVQDRMAFIDDFDAYFDKGYWKSHVVWDGRDTNNQYISALLTLHNLNVKNFMYDFNNFQQSFIEYQNIEGDLSLDAFLEMSFPSNLKTDFSSMRGNVSFVLNNGVLRNFIPFQKLKGIVKKKYLEAPNFTMTAENIIIQNRMLIIPKLEIRSDIAHIVISGTHTFDQDIDYRIRILRIKRRFDKKIYKAQAIQYERTVLLFRFKGSKGKYKLTYDFSALWERIKNKFKKSEKF